MFLAASRASSLCPNNAINTLSLYSPGILMNAVCRPTAAPASSSARVALASSCPRQHGCLMGLSMSTERDQTLIHTFHADTEVSDEADVCDRLVEVTYDCVRGLRILALVPVLPFTPTLPSVMMQMPAADPWGSGLAAASTTKPPRRCRRNGLVKHRFDCGHDADAGARIVKLPFDCVRVTGTPATGSCQGSGGDRKPSHAEATVPSGRGNVFTQSMDSMSACVAMQRCTLRTASTILVGPTRSGTSRSRASTLAS
ncbi:hypothetical protein PC117_g26738 [Phytophthora cactorum]|uniref:Uncharacterized protein n=1 Tax=Phytophthora cactorum TaxID=29920 RepID=A0A8T1AH92_9STRA|nr:hypothetical protein PC117_g26738 [Phytophthora cactorum]